MIELIVEGLVLSAARRDPRMVRLLLALIDRYAPGDASAQDAEEIRTADKQIIEEFIGSRPRPQPRRASHEVQRSPHRT